jgi:anti-anti-sigma factor
MYELSQQGAVDVISGNKPLNIEYVDAVREIINRCTESGQPRIVFNLRGIPVIDSSGLELLLDARDRCQLRGGHLHMATPNGLCGDILRVTGVDSRFEIFDDVLTAVGSFAL